MKAMQVYIGYKFRRNKNKTSLKDTLESISQTLAQLGHTTFILGRDVQKWDKHSISTVHNLKTIFKNLKKSSCIVGFIDADDLSLGLTMEYLAARALRKKIITLIKDDLNDNLYTKRSNAVIHFKNLEDLKQKILSEKTFKNS